MFTRNWHKLLGGYMFVHEPTFTRYDGNTATVSASDGAAVRPGYKNVSSKTPSMHYLQKARNGNGGVILGTGDTPATLEDFALSGELITNFEYTAAVNSKYDDNGVIMTALYTITNSGEEDFTIREIALIGSPGGSSTPEYKILFERTVLDEPVTIPAGGVGQVTYTIRMNYPTA